MKTRHRTVVSLVFFLVSNLTNFNIFCLGTDANKNVGIPSELQKNLFKSGSAFLIGLSEGIKNFDYHKDDELSFPHPFDNKKDFVFTLGKGVGNLFVPICPVSLKARSKNKKTVSLNYSDKVDFPVSYVITKILKDQFLEFSKNHIPWIDNISYITLTPINVFIVKLIFILKKAFQLNDFSFVASDTLRLLFRLSIVDDIYLLDKTKKLSSFFPVGVTEFMTYLSPDIVVLIDDIWNELIGNEKKQKASISTQATKIDCFVFRDNEFAIKCFEKIKNTTLKIFNENIEQLIENEGYSIVDYSDFENLKPAYGKSSSFLDPTKKLVGHKIFKNIISNEELQNILPSNIKNELFNQKNTDNETVFNKAFIFSKEQQNECWVISASNELDITNSIRLIITSFVQAFRKIIVLQKRLFSENSPEALSYQHEWEQYQKERIKIETFLSKDIGAEAIKRLNKKIKELETKPNLVSYENEIKKLKEDLEIFTNRFDKESTKLRDLQKNCNVTSKDIYQKITLAIQNVCESLSKDIIEKESAIIEKEAKLEVLSSEETIVEEKESLLQKLKDFVDECQKTNEAVEPKIFERIKDLEKDLISIKLKNKKTSLEEKLKHRKKVLAVFIEEIVYLESVFKDQIYKINAIKDDTKKIVAEWERKKQFGGGDVAYISHLQKIADRIDEENRLIEDFLNRKKALLRVDKEIIPQEDMDEIQRLENHIKCLVDTFVVDLNQSELQIFMNIFASNRPEFKEVREELLESLKFVFMHNFFIKEDDLLYDYLMFSVIKLVQNYFPELSIHMSKIIQ
jgi:hypothetical protein